MMDWDKPMYRFLTYKGYFYSSTVTGNYLSPKFLYSTRVFITKIQTSGIPLRNFALKQA